MAYREPPRIAVQDAQGDGVADGVEQRPRRRRFDFVRTQRQLDLPRVVIALGLLLAIVGAVLYLATQAARGTMRWLQQQPQYQLRFHEIELSNPPPDWFRGGATAFLRQVREQCKEAEVLPLLALEPQRIDRDFRLFPWVEDVLRVEYPPGGVAVSLVYKQPVAVIPFPRGEFVVLDRHGVILPLGDIDLEKLGPLITITGAGLDQPSPANRPGLPWKSSAPELEGPRLARSVATAALLAGFFQHPDRTAQAALAPALRIKAIVITDPRGLFVLTVEGAMIFWGEGPGSETSGNLSAEEKWNLMTRWAATVSPRVLSKRDFWAFFHGDLKPVKTE